jgi:AraC family transcriptional regulator
VPDLHAKLLLDTSIVRIADVACHSPRCGPGPAEGGDDSISLVVPRRGVFRVHRGASEAIADPNSVVLLGGVEYRVSHPAQGGDDCTALRFDPGLVEEALGSAPRWHGLLSPGSQLRAAVLARGALDRLEAEDCALALLADAAKGLSRDANPLRLGPAGRRRVERVRALLAAEPERNWRLEGIAGAVQCSPFHLARQFRAATGESISRYLVRLRLALSLERLAAGETALARLAVELGFAHHSHFTARFKAHFGITPSEARRIVTASRAATP